MKVTETKDTIVCEATEPSEKAMAVSNAIIDACSEQKVSPAEIFGKGLATCELQFKEKGN